jgi:CARDB
MEKSSLRLTISVVIRLLLPLVFILVFSAGTSQSGETTVFGPNRYLRDISKPSVTTHSFSAQAGAAKLEVNNGTMNGQYQVTSAIITLNGKQILGPSDFSQIVFNFQVPVELQKQNTLTVDLRSAPGSYLGLRITQDEIFTTPFIEGVPTWRRPDLAVISLIVDPDRCDPGQEVTLTVTVANLRNGVSEPAALSFLVDDNEIARLPVPALGSGVKKELTAAWTAQGAGRRTIKAQLILPQETLDGDASNNFRQALVRVSGEPNPSPEVEYKVTLDPSPPTPGQPSLVNIAVRNPGFAELFLLQVTCLLDGQPLPAILGGSEETTISSLTPRSQAVQPPLPQPLGIILASVKPGETALATFAWNNPYPGEHILKIQGRLLHSEAELLGSLESLLAPIPDTTLLYDGSLPHEWTSMGPTIIPQTKSAGRMDTITISPASARVYAAAPFCGVWRSDHWGVIWQPTGDKLSHTVIPAVAIDPVNPDIVYSAAGDWGRPADTIYKSINGGQSWYAFATNVGGGIRKLAVRRISTGVLLYAATSQGLLRYQSTDPMALKSGPKYTSLSGDIHDMVVHPTDNNIVYAVRYFDVTKTDTQGNQFTVSGPQGIYRTKNGLSGNQGDMDWVDVSPYNTMYFDSVAIDLCRSNPKILYASVKSGGTEYTAGLGTLLIYMNANEGQPGSWKLQFTQDDTDVNYDFNYNPFLRVHPLDPNVIYYGGIKLYKAIKISLPFIGSFWFHTTVPNVHADQKTLEFTADGKYYFDLNDGGIWLCTTDPNTGLDVAYDRNFDLRTFMFYDIDVSQSHPDVMIGGLQDNGTLRYQSNLEWPEIRSGDGLYSLIAPSNDQRWYSQLQLLKDTRWTTDGGKTWNPINGPTGLEETANSGDPATKYITVDPVNPNHILAQGTLVQESWDGGTSWKKDPAFETHSASIRGDMNRMLFRPDQSYLASTWGGQIWYRRWWSTDPVLVADVPNTSVINMATAPTDDSVLFVLSAGPHAQRVQRIWQDMIGNWHTEAITGDLPSKHLISNSDIVWNCIAGDPNSTDVVYVGTDKGVFRGELGEGGWQWQPYNKGLPLVMVRDLVPVVSTGELRAATYGRGVWKVITNLPE